MQKKRKKEEALRRDIWAIEGRLRGESIRRCSFCKNAIVLAAEAYQ
jgi:hypothetical protein